MNAQPIISPDKIARGEAVPNATFGGLGGSALRTLLRLVLKRRYTVITIFVLSLLGGFLYTLVTPPSYRATATLEIAREVAPVVEGVNGGQTIQSAIDQEFYETQYGLLRGQALATDVARRLNLAKDAGFLPFGKDKGKTGAAARTERERRVVAKLMQIISIVPGRQSRLVDVRVSDDNPVLAARIANALSEAYIFQNLEKRVARSSYARNFLDRRIQEVRLQLEDSERRLVTYAGQQQIISVPSTREGGSAASGTASQSLAGSDLASMSEALIQARAQRADAQAKYLAAQAAGTNQTEMANPALATLLAQRAQLSGEVAQLASSYDNSYPPLAAKRAQLAETDKQVRGIRGQLSTSLKADYDAAMRREKDLSTQVEGMKSKIIDLSNRSIEYTILQREVDTNRALYEGLLQQYKQITVGADLGSNNINFVLRADVPDKPYAPDLMRSLLIALVLGVVLAISVVMVLEILDARLNTPEDFRERLDSPLLGVVPKAISNEPILDLVDPRSPITEAYSSVNASLRFATAEGTPREMAITSTRPGEGKTTTAIAVAAIMARHGERVVIVDGDMRRPSLHRRMQLSNDSGFSNLLSGDTLEQIQIGFSRELNVHVITAGPLPPSPSDLLANARLDQVLGMLRERFDRVVVDAPPVLGLADAPYIANAVEGVLFVLEANGPRLGPIRRAVERLVVGRGRIIGFVFTKYSPRRSMFTEYGSYDYYGYSYGRGDKDKDR